MDILFTNQQKVDFFCLNKRLSNEYEAEGMFQNVHKYITWEDWIYCKKATKFEKLLQLVLISIFLWPSQNNWTLHKTYQINLIISYNLFKLKSNVKAAIEKYRRKRNIARTSTNIDPLFGIPIVQQSPLPQRRQDFRPQQRYSPYNGYYWDGEKAMQKPNGNCL